jgi:hypothetical protein
MQEKNMFDPTVDKYAVFGRLFKGIRISFLPLYDLTMRRLGDKGTSMRQNQRAINSRRSVARIKDRCRWWRGALWTSLVLTLTVSVGSSAALASDVHVRVSPTAASTQLNSTQQFTAVVTGTDNKDVFWSVNNVPFGQPSTGTIDFNGLYTAPGNLPGNSGITVTATSQEDQTKFASAIITLLATAGGIKVTVSPKSSTVVFDGSQSVQFSATVTGTSNTAVTWSVDDGAGQITSSGLFTPYGFSCANAPIYGVIRATSVANQGAQAVSVANFVPPTPRITRVSPEPAAAGDTLQISGTFDPGATMEVFYPAPNGSSIPTLGTTELSSAGFQSVVPLGSATGPLSVHQVCSTPGGPQFPTLQSNSVRFHRLPHLRIRADGQVLSTGESTQMHATFLGDPTPQPISWSALYGTVTPDGLFTAGSGNWDKVTACIRGTKQCDFFVFSVVPSRIEPTAPVVSLDGTIQLSDVAGTSTLPANWAIEAGGGRLDDSGLYTAPRLRLFSLPEADLQDVPAHSPIRDSGAVLVAATSGSSEATNEISVTGAFPGMVNRLTDYPDISRDATGQTTIPQSIAVDGNRVYVLSNNLPLYYADGHYAWIDAYDACDPAHPVWVGAVEGLGDDLGLFPMSMFASNGLLWRVGAPSSESNSISSEIALYDVSSGPPVLKQYLATPAMWVYSFNQGVLISIPSPSPNMFWQSRVTASVFDGRMGTIVQSRISLVLPHPSTPSTINGIATTGTRLFMLLQQQQSDGSHPFLLSTYDLTSNPPTLLQTISLKAEQIGNFDEAMQVFGNLLYIGPVFSNVSGGGLFDISSGSPVFLTTLQTGRPQDINGRLGLNGTTNGYLSVNYSSPSNPQVTGLVFNGDNLAIGPARLVGEHAYVISSGVQIFDLTAPGGPIPGLPLEGSDTGPPIYGTAIFDLLVSRRHAPEGLIPEPILEGSDGGAAIHVPFVPPRNTPEKAHLFAAEDTDAGPFVTTYDLSQEPPKKIYSLALGGETPFSLVADRDFLFVGTSTELLVLDVSNPAAPAKVASLPIPTSTLVRVGNELYDGTMDRRLVVIDVANPASPVVRTSINLAAFPVTMQANGPLLLIAADTAGLLVYSISNPFTPVRLSQYRPSSAVEGVALDGNLALLAATDGGFVIADLTNPAAPKLAGQFPLDPLICFSDTDPPKGPLAL